MERLTRSENNRILTGVCAGIANYLRVDAWWVRGAFLLLIPASLTGPVLYALLTVLLPSENNPDQHAGDFIQTNLDELGKTVSGSLDKIGKNPRGPVTAGTILICIGAFFLITNLNWLPANIIFPIIVVGLGLYLLRKN
jgi:phage shock protein PspC (stress-responsive transcriptional regulator)